MDNTPGRARPEHRRPVVIRRRRPRRRLRIRLSVLLVLGSIALAAWLVSGANPAGTWDEFLDAIGILDKQRFSQLALLGCLVCSTLAIARVLGYGKK